MSQAKDAQMTSIHSRPQSEGNAQHFINQTELRSILSSLSHELSRPLISLRAGFDLLLAESPLTISHEQRGHLLTMVSLCDDVLQLTRSYLDYAGIVQGSRPLSLGSFTIGALIDEINRQFAPIASARLLNWESRADAPDIVVVTDASRCQQIFGNLVSNALKYTPMGGTVSLSARGETDSWSVCVSDTGPGIPPEALEQVFEPFFRLSRDEHSSIEGSGLGLAICGELVYQLNGQITLDSKVGSGTTVSVRFPMSPAPLPMPPTTKNGQGHVAPKARSPRRSPTT
jgi:signal transduction histidine kinase